MLAILLERVTWDRQSGSVTCRVPGVGDSVLNERVIEIRRNKSAVALVPENRQLVMNPLKDRKPLDIFQSRNDVFEFPHD